VKSVFATMVSPKIVNELLQAETLELGGVRREVTVFFADVRGFTTLTDSSQERVAEFVRDNRLSGAEAEAAFDNQARETLATVNEYLGLIASTIIQHDGTLDKFIGDCVMAFWGAPTPNPRHAAACVQAAVAAQRALYDLNCARKIENQFGASGHRSSAPANAPHTFSRHWDQHGRSHCRFDGICLPGGRAPRQLHCVWPRSQSGQPAGGPFRARPYFHKSIHLRASSAR
jgi:hypothetical protein